MNAHRREHLDLCAALALGAIDEADKKELERHLAEGCPECEKALNELSGGVERLAASAPAATPRPGLKAVVLSRVRAAAAPRERRPELVPPRERRGGDRRDGDRRNPLEELLEPPQVIELPLPERRMTWTTPALAAAAAVLAVATVFLWISTARLGGQLKVTRERLVLVERDLQTEREWAALAMNPAARVVDFTPVGGGAVLPRVRATYDPSSRRAVVVFEGLIPQVGKDFELWSLLPDGPKSLGVVHGDPNGRAEVRVLDAGDSAALTGFAVSLERTGGSDDPRHPAGPVVLSGSVQL